MKNSAIDISLETYTFFGLDEMRPTDQKMLSILSICTPSLQLDGRVQHSV